MVRWQSNGCLLVARWSPACLYHKWCLRCSPQAVIGPTMVRSAGSVHPFRSSARTEFGEVAEAWRSDMGRYHWKMCELPLIIVSYLLITYIYIIHSISKDRCVYIYIYIMLLSTPWVNEFKHKCSSCGTSELNRRIQVVHSFPPTSRLASMPAGGEGQASDDQMIRGQAFTVSEWWTHSYGWFILVHDNIW